MKEMRLVLKVFPCLEKYEKHCNTGKLESTINLQTEGIKNGMSATNMAETSTDILRSW